MKPNALSATISVSSTPLTALPTAKIVRHPQAKKLQDEVLLTPPDEETIRHLNTLAKQHPFCIRHRGTDKSLL